MARSVSDRSKQDLESFTSQAQVAAGKQASEPISTPHDYNISARTPGILPCGDAILYQNGQCPLPAEKAFSIQIGWRLFRLSGASIMSDGETSRSQMVFRSP